MFAFLFFNPGEGQQRLRQHRTLPLLCTLDGTSTSVDESWAPHVGLIGKRTRCTHICSHAYFLPSLHPDIPLTHAPPPSKRSKIYPSFQTSNLQTWSIFNPPSLFPLPLPSNVDSSSQTSTSNKRSHLHKITVPFLSFSPLLLLLHTRSHFGSSRFHPRHVKLLVSLTSSRLIRWERAREHGETQSRMA